MDRLLKTMKDLGKNPAREFFIYLLGTAALAGVGVALFFYRGFSLFLGIPAVVWLLFTFLFFSRYGSQRQRRMQELHDEFVRLFTFFGIYINDGFNVYNALEAIIAYATPAFKPRLQRLLEDIGEDKTVKPFAAFASGFESLQVKEVMISIFQMVDEGNGGPYIKQFERLFGALSTQRHQAFIEKKIGTLESLAILPLVGSGIAIIVLTYSIMEIMGGIANVI